MKYKKGDSLENWNFTVIQENMDLWAEILNDPNPIHLDVNSVKLLGLGEKTINQGHANIAYIINAINYNFPESEIIKLNNKMTDSIVEGDKITVSGYIENIVEKNKKIIITCQLQLNVGKEKVSVVSEADILIKA
tara:strand:- start:409 stop:813 length:405 start_codon:yes stop_codon:yes gene_type:complete